MIDHLFRPLTGKKEGASSPPRIGAGEEATK